MGKRWFSVLGCLAAIFLTWLVFGILWWAPLVFEEAYQALGGVYPTPTDWMIGLAAKGLPLLFAAVYTLWLFALCLRPKPWRAWAMAGMAALAALWLACALAAMAIPLQKCGFHWPEWPWQRQAIAPSPKPPGNCKLD